MLIVKPQLMAILKERNITQLKLEDMSGVPQSAISRFDRNEQHKDIHLFSIARALGLTVEDLFDIEEIDT